MASQTLGKRYSPISSAPILCPSCSSPSLCSCTSSSSSSSSPSPSPSSPSLSSPSSPSPSPSTLTNLVVGQEQSCLRDKKRKRSETGSNTWQAKRHEPPKPADEDGEVDTTLSVYDGDGDGDGDSAPQNPIAAYGWREIPDTPRFAPLVACILERAEEVGLGTGVRAVWYNWEKGLWMYDTATGFYVSSCERNCPAFLARDWDAVVHELSLAS
ncbi:hypothetical protein Q9L58_007760 [Maublancomyces gigas]|uniref:Uncharacterized protein n=1 Tax=Discina gigas TaxID=1032678 RepID=A0ABR3GBJ0_9PEZI